MIYVLDRYFCRGGYFLNRGFEYVDVINVKLIG